MIWILLSTYYRLSPSNMVIYPDRSQVMSPRITYPSNHHKVRAGRNGLDHLFRANLHYYRFTIIHHGEQRWNDCYLEILDHDPPDRWWLRNPSASSRSTNCCSSKALRLATSMDLPDPLWCLKTLSRDVRWWCQLWCHQRIFQSKSRLTIVR